MVTGHVFIAVSVDGYIARSNGELDWLMKQPAQGEDFGHDAFMDSVDGLILGRGTYEKVLTFDEWPYPKPVVVLSSSLGPDAIRKDLADKVRVVDVKPKQIMQRLAEEGWKRAYVDGGKVIQAFLREGLISDMALTRIPILLGGGIPLFGPLEKDIDLKHVATKAYPSGLVHSTYKVSTLE